jgi:hypothetical protein
LNGIAWRQRVVCARAARPRPASDSGVAIGTGRVRACRRRVESGYPAFGVIGVAGRIFKLPARQPTVIATDSDLARGP